MAVATLLIAQFRFPIFSFLLNWLISNFLSNAEIDRASFRAQAIELQNENDQLKKQIEDLKAKLHKEDDKKTDSQTQTTESETKQDPQANK